MDIGFWRETPPPLWNLIHQNVFLVLSLHEVLALQKNKIILRGCV